MKILFFSKSLLFKEVDGYFGQIFFPLNFQVCIQMYVYIFYTTGADLFVILYFISFLIYTVCCFYLIYFYIDLM